MIVSVAAWGVAIAAFGSSNTFWLALAMLALAGWAERDQRDLPDDDPPVVRSRPAARTALRVLDILVVTGGPRIGDVEGGLVARLVSPTFSVIFGGVVCVLGAGLVALLYPELRRARAPQAS